MSTTDPQKRPNGGGTAVVGGIEAVDKSVYEDMGKRIRSAGMQREATMVEGGLSVWQQVMPILQERLPLEDLQTWFEEVSVRNPSDERVVIGVPSLYRKEWIERCYLGDLSEAFSRVYLRPISVEMAVVDNGETEQGLTHDGPPRQDGPRAHTAPLLDGYQLNADYTFDNFVIGSTNKMTHAACQAVANAPAQSYNPMFIYGGVGLGKTHLMQAIGNYVRKYLPHLTVGYLPAEQFVNEFVEAIRRNERHQFQSRYRRVDVLLIDDIHVLAGKSSTQEEFFHTFNALHNARKQIVISSDRPPKDIPTIEDRLRSRFEWGLITEVGKPEYETRLAILQQKCEQGGYKVPAGILELIAQRIDSSIRELEGALQKLAFECEGGDLNERGAARILGDVFRRPDRDISIEKIQKRVAEHFKIRTSDILGSNRSRSIALPRQVAMYLCRKLTSHSFPEIGTFFGNKDHTTVMFACKKIAERTEADEELRGIVQLLTASLQ